MQRGSAKLTRDGPLLSALQGNHPNTATTAAAQAYRELRVGDEGAVEDTSFSWTNTDHRLNEKWFQELLFPSALIYMTLYW